jgi:hypothetical protein
VVEQAGAGAVHEYVGASNAAACLAVQRAELGLVGHTHVAAAWRQTPRGASGVMIGVGEPLDLAGGKWLLNPGAGGAPAPSPSPAPRALGLDDLIPAPG